MAFPLPHKLLSYITVAMVLISFVLCSPTPPEQMDQKESPEIVPHVSFIPEVPVQNVVGPQSNRQGKTIMQTASNLIGNLPDSNFLGGLYNIFNMNGTQFSWIPLGSLLFGQNGNIFGG